MREAVVIYRSDGRVWAEGPMPASKARLTVKEMGRSGSIPDGVKVVEVWESSVGRTKRIKAGEKTEAPEAVTPPVTVPSRTHRKPTR